mgnify:CR=1 FL=1
MSIILTGDWDPKRQAPPRVNGIYRDTGAEFFKIVYYTQDGGLVEHQSWPRDLNEPQNDSVYWSWVARLHREYRDPELVILMDRRNTEHKITMPDVKPPKVKGYNPPKGDDDLTPELTLPPPGFPEKMTFEKAGWNDLTQSERDQLKAPPGTQIEDEEVEDSIDVQIKVKELELLNSKIENEERLGRLLEAQTAKAQIFYIEGLPRLTGGLHQCIFSVCKTERSFC